MMKWIQSEVLAQNGFLLKSNKNRKKGFPELTFSWNLKKTFYFKKMSNLSQKI